MSDDKISETQAILTEANELLREQLEAAGIDIDRVLLAIAPDGAGVLLSNVGSERCPRGDHLPRKEKTPPAG